MIGLNIYKSNRSLPKRLKLVCGGLHVEFEDIHYTHNSVILKIDNKIVGRLFYVSDRQYHEFVEKFHKVKTKENKEEIL